MLVSSESSEVAVEVSVLLLLSFISVVSLELLDFSVPVASEVASVCDRVSVACSCWLSV